MTISLQWLNDSQLPSIFPHLIQFPSFSRTILCIELFEKKRSLSSSYLYPRLSLSFFGRIPLSVIISMPVTDSGIVYIYHIQCDGCTDFRFRSIWLHAHWWYEYEFCMWLSAYNCISFTHTHKRRKNRSKCRSMFASNPVQRTLVFVPIFHHCIIYLVYLVCRLPRLILATLRLFSCSAPSNLHIDMYFISFFSFVRSFAVVFVPLFYTRMWIQETSFYFQQSIC